MTHGISTTTLGAPDEITQDYSKYDLFLDSQGLLQWDGEGAQNSTQTLDLQPPQTDVRNNPNEIPSALGRFFSQSDWSHGSGQGYFHQQSSDHAAYLYSEGFDTSEIGLLKHLPATSQVLDGSPAGPLVAGATTVADDLLFVASGEDVLTYEADGTTATEDPHDGDTPEDILDLTSEGDRVFAALGASGVHLRDETGAWSHYNDAEAIIVAYVRRRLIACSARDIYEIVAGGVAPTSKLELPIGWTYTAIGENGQYIYATAVNESAGLSVVHHFGLDGSLNLEHVGTSALPDGDLAYSFKGYLGMVFIGCGRRNKAGGKDALFYRAEPQDGFLSFSLVAESEGAGALDLSVKSITTSGRKVLLGWSLGPASDFDSREGLAIYDPALDSFTHHLSSQLEIETPLTVEGVSVFNGTVYFTTSEGLYQEAATYVSEAFLISSIATWGNAGLKDWDQTEIRHKQLPATSSVQVQYTTKAPEEGEWSAAGTSATTDSPGEVFRHPGVVAEKFALKLISTATQAASNAPQIESFSTRSNPTLENTEYRLVRTVKIFDGDRSGISGTKALVRQDPQVVRNFIRDRYLDWCQFYESDDTSGYTVRLVKFQELDMVTYFDADGNARTDGFLIVLVLEGTRNS